MKKIVFLFLLFSLLLPTTSIFAKEDVVSFSPDFYKTITIVKGDTLYEICKNNNTTEMNTKSFCSYVKAFNKLSSDTIYPNDNIVIPVFSLKSE